MLPEKARRAYVLVSARRNSAVSIRDAVTPLPEVESADIIMGAFDLVLIVETDSIESLSGFLRDHIHAIDAVVKTTTYIVCTDW